MWSCETVSKEYQGRLCIHLIQPCSAFPPKMVISSVPGPIITIYFFAKVSYGANVFSERSANSPELWWPL